RHASLPVSNIDYRHNVSLLREYRRLSHEELDHLCGEQRVTMGDPNTQQQKVANLKIAGFFSHVFYVDPPKSQTKTEAFSEILRVTGLKPGRVLCVGNRLDLEIAQGKALGLQTCFVQKGDYSELLPKDALEQPDYKIEQISEIMKACQL
ncbi:MAG: HAD hydrolase-like protein, partial [Bdellovibrionia bacterium]